MGSCSCATPAARSVGTRGALPWTRATPAPVASLQLQPSTETRLTPYIIPVDLAHRSCLDGEAVIEVLVWWLIMVPVVRPSNLRQSTSAVIRYVHIHDPVALFQRQ